MLSGGQRNCYPFDIPKDLPRSRRAFLYTVVVSCLSLSSSFHSNPLLLVQRCYFSRRNTKKVLHNRPSFTWAGGRGFDRVRLVQRACGRRDAGRFPFTSPAATSPPPPPSPPPPLRRSRQGPLAPHLSSSSSKDTGLSSPSNFTFPLPATEIVSAAGTNTPSPQPLVLRHARADSTYRIPSRHPPVH